MTAAPTATAAESSTLTADRWRRRRLVAAAVTGAVVLGAGGTVIALAHPFSGAGQSNSGVADNAAATTLKAVTRQTLTSTTSVSGTLKYGGSSSVVAPVGTGEQSLTQAQQQLAMARATLAADQTSARDSANTASQAISQDQDAVTSAQSQLAADEAAEDTDCAHPGQPCTADKQAVSNDQSRLTQAQNALSGAQSQATQSRHQSDAKLAADQTAVQNDENALSSAQASAVNPGSTFTALPTIGQTVSRGQGLYSLSGIPVPLFYGTVTPWRDFAAGMSDGADVGELNDNLIALGFGGGLTPGNHFSAATEAAVRRWQASLGAAQTGVVRLGDVVVQPGAVIVTAVTPSVGGGVQPGVAILQVTSTTREVVVNLDAAQQSQVKVGDRVTITLPTNQTTDGTVSFVGTVATTPSSGNGGGGNNGNSTPTIEVDIALSDPSATGNLDQAPVEVAITTASVDNVLVVPVTALVALGGGGDAVEVVDPRGVHHLVAVTPGLFDDTDGLVQVTGDGLQAGDQVVVPSA